jgi:type 1 glutamine amidotransferase
MLCDLLGLVRTAAHTVMGPVAVAAVAISIVACGSSASSTQSRLPSARPASGAKSAVPTVLVLTQTLGYHHASIPTAIATVRAIAARSGRYRVVFLARAALLTPAALRHAAAVMFLLTTGELPIGAEKRTLVAFVRRGGGLIGFHSATDTFHHWAGYKDMIGAEFSHHPHPSTGRVIVTDHSTAATHALPASFPIHEEFYIFKHNPRPHVHVLAELDTGPSGPDRPLVWCRRFGRGRVYYDALGHFSATWHNRYQHTLASGGILWAVGLARAPSCSKRSAPYRPLRPGQ